LAVLQEEDARKQLIRGIDNHGFRYRGCSDLTHLINDRHEFGSLSRGVLVLPASLYYLGHDPAYQKYAQSGFEIGTMGDRKSAVRFGEEEVEPESCGDGCNNARETISDHCGGDDHRRKQKSGCGARELTSEWNKDERERKGGCG
jgi:hypothetical protein